MRIELIPVIIGALLALAGLLLAADAVLPEGAFQTEERRRSQRKERNRHGELSIAIGMFAMAAALIGRDTWKYSTVAAIIGVIALALGSVLNLGFLKEYLFNRGVTRRGAPEKVLSRQSPAAKRAQAAPDPRPSGTPAAAKPLASQGPVKPSVSTATQKPGPADRSPDQPKGPPKMRDNRKHPRGKGS